MFFLRSSGFRDLGKAVRYHQNDQSGGEDVKKSSIRDQIGSIGVQLGSH